MRQLSVKRLMTLFLYSLFSKTVSNAVGFASRWLYMFVWRFIHGVPRGSALLWDSVPQLKLCRCKNIPISEVQRSM